MKKVPIVLLPDIEEASTPVSELLARQELYLSQYMKLTESNDKAIVFISGLASHQFPTYSSFEVVLLGSRKISSPRFALSLLQKIQERDIKPAFIVAGTPFKPYLISLILKVFKKGTKIQVSVHGELDGIRAGGILGFLRFQFLRFTINRANLIRFVSPIQAEQFRHLINSGKETVITPVPVDTQKRDQKVGSERSVGFVGRIHAERGVDDWVRIVKGLNDVSVIVAGDGAGLERMKSALPEGKFLGHLPQKEINTLWREIGVLLSTAPYESYGLSMREALLNGVPVVSRDNAGARELKKLAPDLISIYGNDEHARSEIYRFLENRPSPASFESFSAIFEREQSKSLQNLALAWRDIS